MDNVIVVAVEHRKHIERHSPFGVNVLISRPVLVSARLIVLGDSGGVRTIVDVPQFEHLTYEAKCNHYRDALTDAIGDNNYIFCIEDAPEPIKEETPLPF